jgi:hypothetical protein
LTATASQVKIPALYKQDNIPLQLDGYFICNILIFIAWSQCWQKVESQRRLIILSIFWDGRIRVQPPHNVKHYGRNNLPFPLYGLEKRVDINEISTFNLEDVLICVVILVIRKSSKEPGST